MAFLIDRGIAAESEEEFDAEGDRYEELKNRLLGGQTMKYEEMEELLAAAKSRNDQKVIDVLKNVVDDPATDGVCETQYDRESNKTNLQSFVVAVDTANATECKNDTTKYVTSGKNLTSGFSMHKDYYSAYKMKNLDDAAKFFVEVKEAYPTYSVWLLQDKYAIAPMKHKLERRDGLRAGWVAGDGWVRYSNKEFVKAVENAEKDRETEKQKVQSMRDTMMARHRQQPASTTGWTMTGIKKEKPKAKSMLDILNCLAESDAAAESEKEPTKSELLDKLIKMCKPGSGVRNALEEIKDKFALDESAASDPTGAPLDRLDAAIGRLKGAGDLAADDVWIEDSKEIVLSYENVGWYENLDKWAEDPFDDVESDLDKIYGALLESGYGLQYSRKAVEKAIADAAVEAASDPEHITPKENRFGDWDSVATCNVHVPFKIVDGPANILPEEEELQEKEEILPDCVVNEAVETLRRMY